MKVLLQVIMVVFVFIFMFGCSKEVPNSIEGKIVDGKGQPMPGLKVLAKQVIPVKGYEQFETVTDLKGVFRFKGLYPNVNYTIFPVSERWETAARAMVESGDGKKTTNVLKVPIMVRFTATEDGILTDTAAGVSWDPSSGHDIERTTDATGARNKPLGVFLLEYEALRIKAARAEQSEQSANGQQANGTTSGKP